MNKDWLKNNITSTLAVLVTLAVIAVLMVCLFKEVKSDEKLTYVIVSSAVNMQMVILGFYYGASKIGNDRQRAEMEIKKTQEQRTASTTTSVENKDSIPPNN